jgi:hypothetical protein
MKVQFPIILTFEKEIEYANFNSEQINLLIKLLKGQSVIITHTAKNLIKFYVPFFRIVWFWNAMIPVDKGLIKIETQNEKNKLIYKVSFLRLIISTSLFSIFIGIISNSLILFLTVFGFIVIGNWLIGWLIQKYYFKIILDEFKTC